MIYEGEEMNNIPRSLLQNICEILILLKDGAEKIVNDSYNLYRLYKISEKRSDLFQDIIQVYDYFS